ncbi:hypothetical protein EW146_g4071 [Bondarzewia mesenterica]|uniref:BTB domain-containing protein n=1 Tax=Bondarzewia mesenterica TaxID=1095465 RepID=A0A4S4LVJ4_9AGAM|nr:hypothetical protein EW146_g4071 [Bondarzewia mesenterica]
MVLTPVTTDNRNGLSSNVHNVKEQVDSRAKPLPSTNRYPFLCFEDGNLAILAEQSYFLVHRGVLHHHSTYLDQLVNALNHESGDNLEGRPVLCLQESAKDIFLFLSALYDGLSAVKHWGNKFQTLSVLLLLSTKYQTIRLRLEVVNLLFKSWPLTLDQWDRKEVKISPAYDSFNPKDDFLHPIMIINLARQASVPELLPSAFYDLSRQFPSSVAVGFTDASTSTHHRLSHDDLVRLLHGRELASRFFSTFIVNELEGRRASQWCYNASSEIPERKNNCQVAFENVTVELLRDVNGVVCNRTSDPLFAMVEGLNLQRNDSAPSPLFKNKFRACDVCRIEFAVSVDAAREDFWRRLPEWFDVEISNWG